MSQHHGKALDRRSKACFSSFCFMMLRDKESKDHYMDFTYNKYSCYCFCDCLPDLVLFFTALELHCMLGIICLKCLWVAWSVLKRRLNLNIARETFQIGVVYLSPMTHQIRMSRRSLKHLKGPREFLKKNGTILVLSHLSNVIWRCKFDFHFKRPKGNWIRKFRSVA